MKDIDAIIKDIDRLKPIPQVTSKVMAIVEDPHSSMSQLSEVITYDHALTANLLRVCNSAYFGLTRRVDSVQQATVYLGMDQIADIVFLAGGAENLKREYVGYDLHEGELWRHSVSSALIARELAEKKGLGNTHLIFTATLLKDIGKVVLSQYVADFFKEIDVLVSEYGFSFKEAEKEVIGIDHAELGGIVAERWDFSPEMVNIIRNHHIPEGSSSVYVETSLVYLADTLCMMMGIGVGCDGLACRFHQDVIERLCFSERDMQEIMAGFGEKLQQIEDMVSLS